MQRIIVFSDSHKNITDCKRVIENLVGVDMIIHAGDHANDAKELSRLFPDIPVRFCPGNCDVSSEPSEFVIEADGKRIFVTHGHNYRVKNEMEYTSLRERAAILKCDCAVFGHTHEPVCDFSKSVALLNPGSIKYTKTYGVIEIENGKLKAAVISA